MSSFAYNITELKFFVADIEQVKKDFTRDSELIFINGKSLKEIYNDMSIIVEKEGLREEHLSTIWNKYCFKGANKEQLPSWQKFANALFHQGGLFYVFESALKEKMSKFENNNETYYSKEIEKEVRITFGEQGLTIQENCTFTKIKDSSGDEENDLKAEKGSYLIKVQLSHYVNIIIEEDGKLGFRHVIEQPEFKCKNLKLQKCLNQKRLSIMQTLRNCISRIISKIFQLKIEPNKASFFQKLHYQNNIKLNTNDDNNNLIEGSSYTKITNHG